MNLLLNLGPIKAGGGETVGINFIKNLDSNGYYNKIFLLVSKGSQLELLSQKLNLSHYSVSNNPIIRVLTEIFIIPFIIRAKNINIIYTLFGFGFFPTLLPQVIGSADSNIYFPEIDFWKDYNILQRIKKKCIDKIRVFGIKRASGVIFENKSMLERGAKLHKIKESIFIPPSISNYGQNSSKYNESRSINLLFLCGWQKNKNYHLIPDILKQSKDFNLNIHIFFTAKEDNSSEHLSFIEKINEENLENMITMTGYLNKDQLSNIYNITDYILLLSQLESFSNNIIESWYFKRVLVISDLEWAKSICENAAVYVDRDDVNCILKKIKTCENDINYKKRIIDCGFDKLKSFPNIEQKVKLELNYIKDVYEKIH